MLALLDAYPGRRIARAQDEREALTRFAEDFGLGDTNMISREDAVEAAVDSDGPLAHLGKPIVRIILATYINTSQIDFNRVTGCFSGNVLLFRAKDGPADRPSIGAMRTYVTGNIIEYPVNSRHADMTNPGPLREIGTILGRHLDSLTPSYPPRAGIGKKGRA